MKGIVMSEWKYPSEQLPIYGSSCLIVWHGVVQNVLFYLSDEDDMFYPVDESVDCFDGMETHEADAWMYKPSPPEN